MKTQKIEQLYRNYAESSAPDMDALWERIESGLEEKNESATSKPIRRKISMTKTIAAVAACIVLVVAVPVAIRNAGKSEEMTSDSAQNIEPTDGVTAGDGVQAEMNEIAEDFAVEDTAAEVFVNEAVDGAAGDECFQGVSENDTVLYENLALDYAEKPVDMPYAETSGDEFFVEENVLIETDVIVNAYVDKVYSDGNGSMTYELTAYDFETKEIESIYFTSATPYVMLEGRCYVIPLKKDGGIYSLSFENAPQIEQTNDGGYIFHNGWECLDENAASVIYPQGGIDDFFYDRMKFSYGSIDVLIDKWYEVKE